MRLVPVVMGDAPPLRPNSVALCVCLPLDFELCRAFTALKNRRDFKQNDIIFSRGIKFGIYGKRGLRHKPIRPKQEERSEENKAKNIPSRQITEPILLPLYSPHHLLVIRSSSQPHPAYLRQIS